jgi:ATP synthase protein I
MQEHDARILRGAALPSAACGVLAIAVSTLFAGAAGALSSALAAVIVLACFGLGQWAVMAVTRRNKDLFLAANVLGFAVKMALLGVLLVTLGNSPLMADLSRNAFVYSALAVVLVWLGGQTLATSKAKILHVDPSESSERT